MAEFTDGVELDWGKCIAVIDEGTPNEKMLYNIVENSTDLPTEQGEKTEARVEGGEVIGTRYQRNKYTLTFQEYGKPSIDNIDGIVKDNHTVSLYNIDNGVQNKFLILRITAVINVQPKWTSQYGTVTTWTCNAVRQNGNSIEWGGVTDFSYVVTKTDAVDTAQWQQVGEIRAARNILLSRLVGFVKGQNGQSYPMYFSDENVVRINDQPYKVGNVRELHADIALPCDELGQNLRTGTFLGSAEGGYFVFDKIVYNK